MNARTEPLRTGAFLMYEANGSISREKISLVAGDALPAGQVLGRITATGKYAAYDAAANDGSQTAAGVLYAPAGASVADRDTVAIVRHAEVEAAVLTGLDAAARADLETLQIICR